MSEKTRKSISVEVLDGKSRWAEIAINLITKYHGHLVNVDIALCWRFGWKPDEDGRQKISEAKRGNDTDRALRRLGASVVVYLNYEVFNSGAFDEREARYHIDHALTMIGEKLDSEGSQVTNETGWPIFRTRKPDVLAFSEVLRRHGPIDGGIRTAREILLANSDRDQTLIAWMENRDDPRDHDHDDDEEGIEEEIERWSEVEEPAPAAERTG